jgi:hypothetical protein
VSNRHSIETANMLFCICRCLGILEVLSNTVGKFNWLHRAIAIARH